MTETTKLFRTKRIRRFIVWVPAIALVHIMLFLAQPWQIVAMLDAMITFVFAIVGFIFLAMWAEKGENV